MRGQLLLALCACILLLHSVYAQKEEEIREEDKINPETDTPEEAFEKMVRMMKNPISVENQQTAFEAVKHQLETLIKEKHPGDISSGSGSGMTSCRVQDRSGWNCWRGRTGKDERIEGHPNTVTKITLLPKYIIHTQCFGSSCRYQIRLEFPGSYAACPTPGNPCRMKAHYSLCCNHLPFHHLLFAIPDKLGGFGRQNSAAGRDQREKLILYGSPLPGL